MDSQAVTFTSILAPYIEGLLKEKQALGYKYETERATLKRFDQYCIDHHLCTINVTKDFLQEWCTQLTTEKISGLAKRVRTVTQLLKYMSSEGIHVYIPNTVFGKEVVLPHIFTMDEIQAFFHVVDTYVPLWQGKSAYRMANEYKVLFRVLCCCGLRNAEASTIKTKNVDLKGGIFTIVKAKNDSNRLVYMSEDLTVLCREYMSYITSELGFVPDYFFPGVNPEKPIPNTSVDAVFKRYWDATACSKQCNNKPTVHDFRFSFITKRINLWSQNGIDISNRLPYLSKYCGHNSVKETYYYYHTEHELYESIRKRDKTANIVIPEVIKNEGAIA